MLKIFTASFLINLALIGNETLHHYTEEYQGQVENVTEISSLFEIEKDFKTDTLIVFDIDEVLITSKDAFYKQQAEKYVLGLIEDELKKNQNPEEVYDKLSLAVTQIERVLIEDATPKILNELKNKGATLVALTSFPVGKFGKISALEEWRAQNLKSFDIDFSSSLFLPNFEILPSKSSSSTPAIFYKGIIFSRGFSKGEVLKTFLTHLPTKPKQIIFVDDLLENHRTISEHLIDSGIQFKGYHFRALSEPSLNKELIQFQLNYLLNHGEWLNDIHAQELLNKS